MNITAWLLQHRRGLAWLGLIILVIAWPLATRLETDRTIDQMFAADDPTLVAYQELRDSFGGNAVVMLVYRDPQLLTPEGLARAGEVSALVADIPGVRGVLSVAQLNEVLELIRPAGFLTGLRGDVPPLLRERDVVAVAFERLFTGYTHSADDSIASVVTLLDETDEQRGYADVLRAMESIRRERMPAGTSAAVLVGEPVLLEQGFDLIERDGERLAWLTVALLSPCVLLLIRSLRFVILQAVVILWAVTLTRATLYVLDFELSLVSSILTAIVTVIAVTAVIHLGVTHRALRGRGYSGKAAATRGFAWVLPPIFWACATDAAGFASLTVSGIVPVREFGWMMALASLAVWAAVLLFSPLIVTGGSSRFASWDRYAKLIDPRFLARWERQVRKRSLRVAVALVRFRVLALLAAATLAALTLVGIGRLEIESSFLRNFRQDSDLVQAYQMVENELSGAGVWDVILDAPDTLSADYMAQVRELEQQLRAIDVAGQQLTKVLSMADADRIATAIPLLRIASPSTRLKGMRSAIPAFSDALLVPDAPHPAGDPVARRKLRIMLRSREHIPAETKLALIEEVERVVAEQTTSAAWLATFAADESAGAASPTPGRVTGYYVMLARVVSQLISDQWRCLAVSAALVWMLLTAATRSPGLALLALIPNLLPVLAVLALLGLSGTKMNMGAAMIAAVSIGLSIDGSVHFMANFRRKIARGRSRFHAVLFAQKQIGLPLLMATFALVIGFSVLAISEFIPTATFGLLTAAALVTGTATNLTLLPALLGGRREPKSTLEKGR